MVDLIELQNRNLSCAIAPELGAAVMRLDIVRRGTVHHILRPTPPEAIVAGADPRQFSLVHLAPICGRVRKNAFKWEGKLKELQPNLEGQPLFTHGVAWQRPWVGKRTSKDAATFTYMHKSAAGWPFDFSITAIFDLEEDNLAITYEITNEGRTGIMPVGFGADMILPRLPHTLFTAGVSSLWHTDAEGVPTHLIEIPFNVDVKEGLTLESLKVNKPLWYQGWSRKASIDYSNRISVMVKTDGYLEHLGLYAPHDKDHFRLAVMSHAPGVLDMTGQDENDTGFRVLGPGESISSQYKIDIDLNLY